MSETIAKWSSFPLYWRPKKISIFYDIKDRQNDTLVLMVECDWCESFGVVLGSHFVFDGSEQIPIHKYEILYYRAVYALKQPLSPKS